MTPTRKQAAELLDCYQNERFSEAENLAIVLVDKFPTDSFAWKILVGVFLATGRLDEAHDACREMVKFSPRDPEAHYNLGVAQQRLGKLANAEKSFLKAITLQPNYAEAHCNLGIMQQQLGRLAEAEKSFGQAISLKPEFAEAHNAIAIVFKQTGRLEEAEASYKTAIAVKPDFVNARVNYGNTLSEMGNLKEAEINYKQALALRPSDAKACWCLHGIQKTLQSAEYWIEKCLEIDGNHTAAKLTKAALKFYRGEREEFDRLMRSELRNHPYMRSFNWVFNLPNLPELYFNRWYFFDAIVKKSNVRRPFYEFGVWRGTSFRYFMDVFKKGFGFDTFLGLPEDWVVGAAVEKEGFYSSNGRVPDIEGGQFIVGQFEDTLPTFFSESRPVASLINFDADLYSSTICALKYCRSVIDENTILIFDEFLINEGWENDEHKALIEFCSIFGFSYEVLAVSFFSKQVALRLERIKCSSNQNLKYAHTSKDK